MSYKCELCERQIKNGIPQMKIITKTQMMICGITDVGIPQIREEKKACPNCYNEKDMRDIDKRLMNRIRKASIKELENIWSTESISFVPAMKLMKKRLNNSKSAEGEKKNERRR